VALGALHGPAELLPISSSAHVTLLPWLLGWQYPQIDPGMRKAFEVALHAGTAAGLLVLRRRSLEPVAGRGQWAVSGAACAIPALAGYAWAERIEARLGTPGTIAGALLVGAATMLVADRRAEDRSLAEASVGDGVWLGIAQAAALVPGVSRAGATVAAARLRRFRRRDARRLSDQVALPVLVGAALFEAAGVARRGVGAPQARWLAAGAAASFASTSACARVAAVRDRGQRLAPYALYRALLAGLVLIRLRRASTARPPAPARG
jgi:undecaprenyl-diphosphatase